MSRRVRRLAALALGFCLDQAIGDPQGWPHPVRLIGKQIEFEEKLVREHALSETSGHTEAACAGALGIRLGGPSRYFGKVVAKPEIGDDQRPVEAEDIVRANRLLYATAAIGLGASAVLSLVLQSGHGTSTRQR